MVRVGELYLSMRLENVTHMPKVIHELGKDLRKSDNLTSKWP